MDAHKPFRTYTFLSLILLLLPAVLEPATVTTATGHFEMYCDGVGIFLANIYGAPAPAKLVMFSQMSFPPGTIGGRYFGQGKWSNVYVFRDGCVPDGKCDKVADGRVWIDGSNILEAADASPARMSGKYEIDLNGKHLEGSFVVKRHVRKHPVRLCM